MIKYKIKKLTPEKFRLTKENHQGRILTAIEGSRTDIMEVAIDSGLLGVALGFKKVKTNGDNLIEFGVDGRLLYTKSTLFEEFGILLH